MDPTRPRPPYVKFERRVIERMTPQGTKTYEDVDFVCVTPLGSKDTVERVAAEWIQSQRMLAAQDRVPLEWVNAWEDGLQRWKSGQEIPLNGSPLKTCPAFHASEIRRCVDLHILTIEDLASANVEAQQRLGMGAVSMVQRARDWLKAAEGTAPLITQLDAARVENEKLKSDLTLALSRITALEAVMQQVQQHQSVVTAVGAAPLVSEDKELDSIAEDAIAEHIS